jgi:hypothetical protein
MLRQQLALPLPQFAFRPVQRKRADYIWRFLRSSLSSSLFLLCEMDPYLLSAAMTIARTALEIGPIHFLIFSDKGRCGLMIAVSHGSEHFFFCSIFCLWGCSSAI